MTARLANPSIKFRPWSALEDEIMARMAGQGKSGSEIGEALGRPRNSVIGRCHRQGIKLRGKKCENKGGRPRKAIAQPIPLVAQIKPLAQPSAPIAVPQPRPPAQPEAPRMITLMHLTRSSCRWPFGDPKKPDFRYCGLSQHGDSPYCEAHQALAYNRARAA